MISQLLLLLLLLLPAVTATNTVITNAVAAITFTRTNTTTGNASSATTKSNCRQIVPLASNKYTEKQVIYNYLTRTNDTIRERETDRKREKVTAAATILATKSVVRDVTLSTRVTGSEDGQQIQGSS